MTTGNKEWRPTKKQEVLVSLPDTILEAFYAGAVGAGKTDILLLLPFLKGWHRKAGFKALFLRRTFTELKNEVIPRTQTGNIRFDQFGGKYNTNDKVWTFPEFGSYFFFGHCENEKDVYNYDSMQPNCVLFDELTSFLEFQYLYITLTRVRSILGSGLPAVVRSASNPGNIGHNWVRQRFIDPAPKGFKLIRGKSGIKRIFIPATVNDNPHIDPVYRQSLEALPEAEKQAKLYGNWSAFEGSVFSEFREKHYPDEPENALHIVKPFDIPAFWPRIVTIDWGYAPPAMTYVGYGAISPSKRIYFYREQSWQKTSIEEWGGHVKAFIDRENPRIIRVCKSAGQHRGQKTIQEQIEEALNRQIELTDNSPGSRVATKLVLHEYLRWKQKFVPVNEVPIYDEEKAQWILRNKGLESYKLYLSIFDQIEEEQNLPKLLIFEQSPEGNEIKLLPNAIKTCVYDKTHTQDVAEFPGDDAYDVIRYMVECADNYFGEAESEFKKVQKQQELIDKLTRDQDWTAFYRNSLVVESQTKIQPINRYHRKRIH